MTQAPVEQERLCRLPLLHDRIKASGWQTKTTTHCSSAILQLCAQAWPNTDWGRVRRSGHGIINTRCVPGFARS